MPTPEVPSQPLEATSEPQAQEAAAEQQFKTLAIRVQDSLHAQLSFVAQLNGNSIAEEIRRAIDDRLAAVRDDPELIARAQQVSQQIERDAAVRTAAIASFMGATAVGTKATPIGSSARGRQAGKRGAAEQ